MANDIKDDPEVKRGIEMVLAICKPQFDALMAEIRKLAEERREINDELRASFEEKRAAQNALLKLLAQIKEADPQDLPCKPPTRSIQ